MKFRNGFVSNSSSTSFVIINNTNKTLTLVDFVEENPQLIQDYIDTYGCGESDEYTQEELVESAYQNNITFYPYSKEICTFGDEQGTLIGGVFDYILRDGGHSKSFSWSFYEYNR